MNKRACFELTTAAAVLAAEAHAGQKRKELNEPYIVHPLRVGKLAAMLEQDEHMIAACYLHDVVEDTVIPMTTIESLFPAATVELVKAATKWWAEGHGQEIVKANKAAYYANILSTPGAITLKVLDRVDNLHDFAKMARLSPSSHKWAKRYYGKTVDEFGPLLEKLDTDVAHYVVVPEEPGNHSLSRLEYTTRAGTAAKARKFFDAALSALDAAL